VGKLSCKRTDTVNLPSRVVLNLVFDGYESACTTSVVTNTFPRFAGDELTM